MSNPLYAAVRRLRAFYGRPGGLHHIFQVLAKNNINVEYMYAFVRQSGQNALLIFRFDDVRAAGAVLKQEGMKVIDRKDLYAM